MFSDTFTHRLCSKLCWQLSWKDANNCPLVQFYISDAAQRWVLVVPGWVEAWWVSVQHHRLRDGLRVGCGLCCAQQRSCRTHRSQTCLPLAEGPGSLLLSWLWLAGPALWGGTLLGVGSLGRRRGFLQQAFLNEICAGLS